MKNGLVAGIQAETTFEVTPDMRPDFDGKAIHPVCSTWSLVHQMEIAGRMVLIGYLEPHEEGVGSHASCDHLGPAAVGRTVRVVATATSVTDRELVCEMVASCDDRMIARGKTVQRVFPREILERILRKG